MLHLTEVLIRSRHPLNSKSILHPKQFFLIYMLGLINATEGNNGIDCLNVSAVCLPLFIDSNKG